MGGQHISRERHSKSKWASFVALLSFAASTLFVCCSPKTDVSMEGIDQSTPEAVISSWYQAANTQDLHSQRALADSDSDMMETALRGSERLIKAGIAYRITDVEMYRIDDNSHEAKFRVKYKFTIITKTGDSEVQIGGALLRLRRKGERWYITSLGDDL